MKKTIIFRTRHIFAIIGILALLRCVFYTINVKFTNFRPPDNAWDFISAGGFVLFTIIFLAFAIVFISDRWDSELFRINNKH